MEGLRKTRKYLSQDSRPSVRDLNPRPSEHEGAGVLSLVLDVRPVANESLLHNF
jgi:hypothetical protein